MARLISGSIRRALAATHHLQDGPALGAQDVGV